MPVKYTLHQGTSAPTRQTVTITKKLASTELGVSLLSLLLRITEDGELSLSEIEELKRWLDSVQGADIPATVFLRSQIAEILSDGHITALERDDLLGSIQRVLPKEHREEVQRRREHARGLSLPPLPPGQSNAGSRSAGRDEPWRSEPATDRQREYIDALGADLPGGATKGQASDLIESLLAGPKSISNRQMMVLRFWNQVAVAQRGREGVSEWMDNFYCEHPEAADAWELWKEEHGDIGRQDNPNKVPLGAGLSYIKKVGRSGGAAKPFNTTGAIFALFVFGVMIAMVSSAFFKAPDTIRQPRSRLTEPSEPRIPPQRSTPYPRVPIGAPQRLVPAHVASTPSPRQRVEMMNIPLPPQPVRPLSPGTRVRFRTRVVLSGPDGLIALTPGTVIPIHAIKGSSITLVSQGLSGTVNVKDVERAP